MQTIKTTTISFKGPGGWYPCRGVGYRFLGAIYIIMLTALPGFTKTITVCKRCEINTIQKAVQSAEKGDIVEVHHGIYLENNIVINKPISIKGRDLPAIDGQNQGEIFTIIADSVTLTGLMIRNVGTSYTKDQAGINVKKSRGTVISDNILYNTFFGIYLQNSSHCTIVNNKITGEAEHEMSSGNAIHLWYCKNILIKNNRIRNHRDGIYLEFVDNSQIINNVSEENIRYGLHFMFSNGDKYLGNTFRNNGAGVAVMFSRNIIMHENMFLQNWGPTAYGLLLKEIYDGEITRNQFIQNTIAIYGESATRLLIKHNLFKQNGWALKILGSCMDNTITKNDFISNTFEVSTNSKRNYNSYDGNYWNDYTGYDLDRDGVGDVPHRPVKLFSYMVTRVDPSIILLRSLFVDIVNFAEKVTPVFTPETLLDNHPLMKPVL